MRRDSGAWTGRPSHFLGDRQGAGRQMGSGGAAPGGDSDLACGGATAVREVACSGPVACSGWVPTRRRQTDRRAFPPRPTGRWRSPARASPGRHGAPSPSAPSSPSSWAACCCWPTAWGSWRSWRWRCHWSWWASPPASRSSAPQTAGPQGAISGVFRGRARGRRPRSPACRFDVDSTDPAPRSPTPSAGAGGPRAVVLPAAAAGLPAGGPAAGHRRRPVRTDQGRRC